MRRYLVAFGASGVLAQQEVNEDVSIQLQKLNDNANDIDVHLVEQKFDEQNDENRVKCMKNQSNCVTLNIL